MQAVTFGLFVSHPHSVSALHSLGYYELFCQCTFQTLQVLPKAIWEEPRRQPSRQSGISLGLVTMGLSKFTQTCPSPSTIFTPSNAPIRQPSADPLHLHKRHPDPISRFATILSGLTDGQTDGHMGLATTL